MGKEAEVDAVLADGRDHGRLQYEAPRLIFRGRERRVFEGAGLLGLRAEGADLVLASGERFVLGEKAAASWVNAILHPKGRIDKLGLKAGMTVALLGVDDAALPAELKAKDVAPGESPAAADVILYAADSTEQLAKLVELASALKPRAALWVVSRKGKTAGVKDIEVLGAARAAGLVDNKVVSFSDTHTALRFTRRTG
jgi:hypothetical protein